MSMTKTIMTDYLYTNHCYSPGYVPKDTVRDWCDYAHRDYLEVVMKKLIKDLIVLMIS